MTFVSDPNKPGSDSWAMLDAEGARLLGPRQQMLRREMLAIRRFTADSGSWTPAGARRLARILEPGGIYDQWGARR
jgi:hypothetical protein